MGEYAATTYILNIPHTFLGINVLAQDLLDLLAARGLNDDGAAGKVKVLDVFGSRHVVENGTCFHLLSLTGLDRENVAKG